MNSGYTLVELFLCIMLTLVLIVFILSIIYSMICIF